ncbi:MAG: hypothetical protein EXQ53_00610 [Acidobacteria bacterium]|nr:hypothetical protein [Acidobacteriota bacterium]
MRRHLKRVVVLSEWTLSWVAALSSPAWSQTRVPPADQPVKLSGPRVGVTFLSDGIVDKLRDESIIDVGSVVTQFGWQCEKRLSNSDSGLTPVTEWVLLLGGLEQGVALPSLTWLVGLLARNGAEFGVGPNVTPVGVALAVAAGVTFHSGSLNLPVNLAVVPSKSGVRVSVLAGFNMRR